MPIDRPAGISGLGPTPVPSSSVRPATPAGALVPVAPVRPRGQGVEHSPLGRSGVDVGDLLFAEDALAERTPSTRVALSLGLERARGALVRQAPGEALAALDDVWHDARKGEQGWYLRAGALTAMGLPGEGDRVAGDGLAWAPESRALRFVQSVARLLVGDLSGARSALMPALAATPDEPVLLAQQAVVLARQGHGEDARGVLATLQARVPHHPALEWARRMVQSIQADGTRQQARHVLADWPVDADDAPDDAIADLMQAAMEATDGDVQDAAFVRLGQVLVTQSPAATATRIRALIVAYSAGGHMSTAVPPEQAHAARSMLGAMLSVVSDAVVATEGESQASAAARPVLASLWGMLQARRTQPRTATGNGAWTVGKAVGTADGRAEGKAASRTDAQRTPSSAEVVRAARRMASALPPAMRPLLDALIRGGLSAVGARDTAASASLGFSAHASAGSTPLNNPSVNADGFGTGPRRTPHVNEPIMRHSGEFAAVLHEERDVRAPLVPIRLGLALLEETQETGNGARGLGDLRSGDLRSGDLRSGDLRSGDLREMPPGAVGHVARRVDAGGDTAQRHDPWLQSVRFTPSHVQDLAHSRSSAVAFAQTAGGALPVRDGVDGPGTPVSGVDVRGAEGRAEGWGAATHMRHAVPDAGGRRLGLAAIVLVGGAIVAATQGAPVIAIALGLGAAWMGLRRG